MGETRKVSLLSFLRTGTHFFCIFTPGGPLLSPLSPPLSGQASPATFYFQQSTNDPSFHSFQVITLRNAGPSVSLNGKLKRQEPIIRIPTSVSEWRILKIYIFFSN